MASGPQPEIRSFSGTIPNDVLGLIASLSDPVEAAGLVAIWDASVQSGQWHDWRTVAAYDGETPVGAVIGRRQPGNLATVWVPRTKPTTLGGLADIARMLRPPAEDDFEHELAQWQAENDGSASPVRELSLSDRLLKRLVADLTSEGSRLLQSVLPVASETDALALARAGFSKLADLLYLQCNEEAILAPPPAVADTLTCRPCADTDHDLLCEILAATYEGTLDCPALNGLQSPADVLTGYAQTGQTGRSGWRIFCENQEPVGCVLMAGHRAEQIAELVYMGLRPTARGRRNGLQLVRQGQAIAREWNSEQVVLAVDAGNIPARKIYERCGFVVWDSRRVFVRREGPCS